jgi:hypothetical protein
MKICWDNLENKKFSKSGNLWYKSNTYYFHDCKTCNKEFIGAKNSKYCTLKCMANSAENKIQAAENGRKGTGKPITDEHKRKISISKLGKQCKEKNPNWKGGISDFPYCEIWRDKDYKMTIMERDGHICKNPLCNGNSKKLCLHHIDYNKLNCQPKNLITICFSCNSRANFDRDFWEAFYKKMKL